MSRGVLKLTAGVVGLAAALAVLSALGEGGVRRVTSLRREVARVEALNRDLEAENRRLILQIRALRDDPRTLEAVAREELGLVRPGEVVFRFEGGAEARGGSTP